MGDALLLSGSFINPPPPHSLPQLCNDPSLMTVMGGHVYSPSLPPPSDPPKSPPSLMHLPPLLRSLLRKYPDFPDMRAALAAALWADGLEAQAESSWCV